MAKPTKSEPPSSTSTTVAELKKELMRLAKRIADENDETTEALDRLSTVAEALKEINVRGRLHLTPPPSPDSPAAPSQQRKVDTAAAGPPAWFVCPLSSEIMKDPVVVSSGQTYDRPFIQSWLNRGNRTCPRTDEVLSHVLLTPNKLVSNMIKDWCESRGVQFPSTPSSEFERLYNEGIPQKERAEFRSLFDKLSSPSTPPSDLVEAASKLRLLMKRSASFRSLLAEFPGSIARLLFPLQRKDSHHHHPKVCEDIVTSIFNASLYDANKKILSDNPETIPLLIEALRAGTTEARRNSAAALSSLASLESNKAKIVKAGALRPLLDLLGQGDSMGKKDAASAVFVLCVNYENKARAVKDGAIPVIVDALSDSVFVDEAMAMLALFSSNPQAVEEMGSLGLVPALLGILRKEELCGRIKENAVAVLYAICAKDPYNLDGIMEEEEEHRALGKLSKNGTPRAQRKALGILEKLTQLRHRMA